MAHLTPQAQEQRARAPYLAQDQSEVDQMLGIMNDFAKQGKSRSGFGVRKKTYRISDQSGRTVESWSLNDWDYKKPGLPTYARGLFTHSNNGKPEIAVRGYDKFFNVGEVQATEWKNVEATTRGPYELSVKENGCIIFIAGLDDQTLLVTSKHSTGHRSDASANHALAGEKWIQRQLEAIGKSRADLAKHLRERNVTAVAELCDDEFEEHVLQYTPEQAGLYLHGINLNLPEFATYPGALVDEFAEAWGFKKVQYVIKDTIEEVKPFLEEVAKTGNYSGRDTEGFVIRCQARENSNRPWHDWFFKYKFDEPYLMYRQWREVTKAVIAGKVPKIHKHKVITEEYINYARRQLAKDRHRGEAFNRNHGIIAMRDGFLAEKGVKGHEIIQSEEASGDTSSGTQVTNNVLLIPVATIGCGKTTVALALSKLFDWGHEQNDNIEGKGRPQKFAIAITNLMAAFPVVIADRNNHQRRERAQILDDVRRVVPDATCICLHWVHNADNFSEIRRTMQERVLGRGDNHQTIHPDTKGPDEIIGIMDGFLQRFEPVDEGKRPDSLFDLVIDLDVTADSRANLATIIREIHTVYPKLFEMPTEQAMDQAIDWALDYKPMLKHDLSGGGKNNTKRADKLGQRVQPAKQQWQGQEAQNYATPTTPGQSSEASSSRGPYTERPKKAPRVEYFCVSLPASRVKAALDAVFETEQSGSISFYNQLKASRRVQKAFHVTLIHRASQSQHAEYWNKLNDLWTDKVAQTEPTALIGGADGGIDLGSVRVELERVVWDGRVMAIVARLLDVETFKSVNATAHVTVGTAADSIKPKESNDMLQQWLRGSGDGKIKDATIRGALVLDGTVKAMLSR